MLFQLPESLEDVVIHLPGVIAQHPSKRALSRTRQESYENVDCLGKDFFPRMKTEPFLTRVLSLSHLSPVC